MTDTPISLLKIVLAEVEDECTCNATRDRCLHCRIKKVLQDEEARGVEMRAAIRAALDKVYE